MTDGNDTDWNTPSTETDLSVDVQAIRDVLADHPVRLAVLFGSRVDGTADESSDIDVAVEFDPAISDPSSAVLSLLADLSIALDRNDLDVGVIDDLTPRVGLAAFEEGVLLYGSNERAAEHRERFAERVASKARDRSLRERFDDALRSIDRHVDGEA